NNKMKLATILVASAIAAHTDPIKIWRDANKKTGFTNSVMNAIKRHNLNISLTSTQNERRSVDLINSNDEPDTTATLGTPLTAAYESGSASGEVCSASA
ncbi:hypothetical protein HK100_001449, partial [Physocladia obscura]